MRIELSQEEVAVAVVEYVKKKLHIDQTEATMLEIKVSEHFSCYNVSVNVTDRLDEFNN